MTDEPTKTCRECGNEKPVSAYHRKPSGKYGVDTMCRQCRRKYSRRRRLEASQEKDPDKELAATEPEYKYVNSASCEKCPCLQTCANRVRRGWHVKCEIPDFADLRRMQKGYELA